MPVLANPRQERFAQLLAQLHGEMTVTDAHEQAGYKRNDGNASTLSQHPDVQKRVKEIKGRVAAKAQITAESLIDEFEEVRAAAMGDQASRQFNAANNAIKGKAVLTGHWVEKAEIGQPGEFDHLTDEELQRTVRDLMVELGLLPPDAGGDKRH